MFFSVFSDKDQQTKSGQSGQWLNIRQGHRINSEDESHEQKY